MISLNKRQYLIIYCCISLIFVLINTSCNQESSSKNDKLLNLLNEYIGQKLILPDDTACVLFDRTYGANFLNADYLVVSYIDTEGCTPCHLHLPYWKELNDRLDTLSKVYATTLLIIRPDTLSKVTEYIRQANYKYPLIIDTIGGFSKMNALPDFKPLHTLLVDKEHNILALGNPIENRAIDRIYMKIIIGEKSDNEEKTPLLIDNNKVDIGTVPPGSKREFEFVIKNQSNDSIRVGNILTPCECIEAEATDIMPASVGTINIAFQAPDFNGAFHHPVVVRYNDICTPIIIHLYGMVSL